MTAETGRIRCEAQGVHTAPDGSAYRFRLVGRIDEISQWSVTRTEAVIVETRADATRAEVEAAIASHFGAPDMWFCDKDGCPGHVGDESCYAREPARPPRWLEAEICGACGKYIVGGADPSVMSTHDCEGEEQ